MPTRRGVGRKSACNNILTDIYLLLAWHWPTRYCTTRPPAWNTAQCCRRHRCVAALTTCPPHDVIQCLKLSGRVVACANPQHCGSGAQATSWSNRRDGPRHRSHNCDDAMKRMIAARETSTHTTDITLMRARIHPTTLSTQHPPQLNPEDTHFTRRPRSQHADLREDADRQDHHVGCGAI